LVLAAIFEFNQEANWQNGIYRRSTSFGSGLISSRGLHCHAFIADC
jgi:hypothetical protein